MQSVISKSSTTTYWSCNKSNGYAIFLSKRRLRHIRFLWKNETNNFVSGIHTGPKTIVRVKTELENIYLHWQMIFFVVQSRQPNLFYFKKHALGSMEATAQKLDGFFFKNILHCQPNRIYKIQNYFFDPKRRKLLKLIKALLHVKYVTNKNNLKYFAMTLWHNLDISLIYQVFSF